MISLTQFNAIFNQLTLSSITILIIFLIFSLILLPFLLIVIVSQLGQVAKKVLVQTLGGKSQIIVGGLGVIIHELSHTIVALLFGHHITKLRLLNIQKNTTSLGSVKHYYNSHNLYQKMGNFFIGLAPFYGCAFCLEILQNWFFQTGFVYQQWGMLLTSGETIRQGMLATLVLPALKAIFVPLQGRTFGFLLLVLLISSTGFSLSNNDLRSAVKGILPLAILCSVVGILMAWLGQTVKLVSGVWFLVNCCLLLAIKAIIFILIALLPLLLLLFIRRLF